MCQIETFAKIFPLAEGTPLLRLDDIAAYVAHCLGQS